MNWEKWSINQYISLGTKGKSSGLVSESFPSSLKAQLSTCILSEQKPEIRTDCRVLSREEQILPLSEPTTYSTDLTVASRHPNNLLTVCYSLLYMTVPCHFPTSHHPCLENITSSFFFLKAHTYYRSNPLSCGLRAVLSPLCNIAEGYSVCLHNFVVKVCLLQLNETSWK